MFGLCPAKPTAEKEEGHKTAYQHPDPPGNRVRPAQKMDEQEQQE
jgi:hypothetical protein